MSCAAPPVYGSFRWNLHSSQLANNVLMQCQEGVTPPTISLITPLPHFLLHVSARMKDGGWDSGGQALAQLSNHQRSSFLLLPSADGSSVNGPPVLASPLER